jgi:competence protein ComEA
MAHGMVCTMPKLFACAGFLTVPLIMALPAFGQATLPVGPAKHLVETACSKCHALTRVTGAGHSRPDWDVVVHRMINAGAEVPADQVPPVIDYLARNFPPKTLPPAGAGSSGVQETPK